MAYPEGFDRDRVDIIDQLRADHRALEGMFDRWDMTVASSREVYFCELVPVLVSHEVAEEEILYPAVRSVEQRAAPTLDARLAEQAQAEMLLFKLEKIDPATEEFGSSFTDLRRSVLAHAEREEAEIFPLLDRFAESLDRTTMGVRYKKAKAAAPTHPHPHAPDTPPGNLVLGPVAAMVDRVRDAIR